MTFPGKFAALLVGYAVLAACSGSHTAVPLSEPAVERAPLGVNGSAVDNAEVPGIDNTSILKKLKKDIIIGSTVDPTNGDKGPRGISVAALSYGGLRKGQVLVCNFENSSGEAGKGTTIEKLDPKPGSKPTTFVQSTQIEGCSDVSISPASDDVYASGSLSHQVVQFTQDGKLGDTWGKPLVVPFSLTDAACTGHASFCGYSAEYIFASDSKTGGIVSFSVNYYGNPKPLEVIAGFAVNKESGWAALGPSGVAFRSKNKGTLYVADGVDNTIVSFNNATELLVPDEIVVQKGGKTFKCKYPKTTCGTLIYSGSPLNGPVAMTLLPNGNIIAANTLGGNMLVELTPTGKVLATKVVDSSKVAGVYGIRAIGTNDNNTALYYTDTNDNSLHKLEQ